MEDKLKDRDVLLVKEGDQDSLKVVSGIDPDGKLKTVPPKKEHEQDFMKIDKHSNVLENFFANFMRQAKEPTHFGFFKGSASSVESDALVLNEMLRNPDNPSNKEALDSARVKPEDYIGKSQEQSTQKQSSEYKPYDVERIDWAQFEKIGITRETLEKHKALDDMLNYRKSPGLIPLSVKLGDDTLRPEVRLSLRETEDGRIVPRTHPIIKEPKLDDLFFGHKFSEEDKKALRETGNMGRLAELKFPGRDTPVKCFVSIDRQTNEIVPQPVGKLRLPEEIKGVKLNDEQKKALAEGKGVYLEGMTAKSGKSFAATVQFNADKRGIEFIFPDKLRQSQKQEQSQQQSQPQGEKQLIVRDKLLGRDVSPEEKADLKAGKVVYMEGLKDDKGQLFNAYVKPDFKEGRFRFIPPEKYEKNRVQPDNASQTQVAVNSEGKSNEATKHVHDPLQKGQTQPTPAQREEIQENHEEPKKRTGVRL